MTSNAFQGEQDRGGYSNANTEAEASIQVAVRNGERFVLIKEQRLDDSGAPIEHMIEIPFALLPELKRAVMLIVGGLSDAPAGGIAPRPAAVFAPPSEEELVPMLDIAHARWGKEPPALPLACVAHR